MKIEASHSCSQTPFLGAKRTCDVPFQARNRKIRLKPVATPRIDLSLGITVLAVTVASGSNIGADATDHGSGHQAERGPKGGRADRGANK